MKMTRQNEFKIVQKMGGGGLVYEKYFTSTIIQKRNLYTPPHIIVIMIVHIEHNHCNHDHKQFINHNTL